MNRMRILVLFYRIIDTVVTRHCIVVVLDRKSNNSNIKTLYSSRDSQNKDHYLKTQIMISVQKPRVEGLEIERRKTVTGKIINHCDKLTRTAASSSWLSVTSGHLSPKPHRINYWEQLGMM